jgi:hypothetical protein
MAPGRSVRPLRPSLGNPVHRGAVGRGPGGRLDGPIHCGCCGRDGGGCCRCTLLLLGRTRRRNVRVRGEDSHTRVHAVATARRQPQHGKDPVDEKGERHGRTVVVIVVVRGGLWRGRDRNRRRGVTNGSLTLVASGLVRRHVDACVRVRQTAPSRPRLAAAAAATAEHSSLYVCVGG